MDADPRKADRLVDRNEKLLSGVFPFGQIRGEERRRLASGTLVRDYAKGTFIFSEGDPPDFLYVVARGQAKVVKVAPNGSEIIFGIFGAGDPLGAVAVYKELPFPASAVAMQSTRCILIPRRALFGALEANPGLARDLLAILSRRLVELTNRLTELAGGRVESRLARIFLKLASELGQAGADGGSFIPLRLTRRELADLTGVAVETCIRVCSRWTRDGILETERRGFLIRDRPALERLATS